MKRAEKKIIAEEPIRKAKNPEILKSSKGKKPIVLNSQKTNLTEKTLTKSLPQTSAKISVSTETKNKNINSNLTIESSEKSKEKKSVEVKSTVEKKNAGNKTSDIKKPQKIELKADKAKKLQKKSDLSVKNAKVSDKNINSKTAKANQKTAKKEPKAVEKIEAEIPTPLPKPVKKKLKPIGSAVVRGRSGRYDFEVFPLDAELRDGSAIYLISKRITDKQGRGHHKFVCIGQTESLLGDLKRHKKDRCIKEHKANVICLLREENEKSRLKIETDLREAHTIFCNQK